MDDASIARQEMVFRYHENERRLVSLQARLAEAETLLREFYEDGPYPVNLWTRTREFLSALD